MDSEKIQQQYNFGKTPNRGGRALGGLVLVGLGVVWLIHRMHPLLLASWIFTWPMFLIAIGFYIAARKGFSRGGWEVLMIVGAVFLIPHIYRFYTAQSISEYTWPLVVIVFGLYMILRPRRNFRNSAKYQAKWDKYQDWTNKGNTSYSGQSTGETSADDFIDATSVFGGVDRVVVSKNFKGGRIENIFGGCDLNLTQADFNGTVTIDFVNVFGGATIIVPTDWKVVVKTTSIFGGTEDKRPPAMIKENPDKTLIIDGTSIFGGVTIQCY